MPGESFPAPLVDIELLGPAGKILVTAVIDSGAYRPVFPLKTAETAGIELSKCANELIQYGGSTTAGKVARTRIELIPGGPVLDTTIVFVEMFDLPYALLGRVGFFDRFNEVSFAQKMLPARVELRW